LPHAWVGEYEREKKKNELHEIREIFAVLVQRLEDILLEGNLKKTRNEHRRKGRLL